ncbi:STAS domain-containing protein [Pantanalinema rosaneae CENA516]|uniref:STAS domain-containing protein n=1 Tax=Pantanalinema rosaneae TaxID=1620701 RepID=UPI003D6F686F
MSANTDIKVLQPSGILTAATAPDLLQEFNHCLKGKPPLILVNLQSVDFIDSSGLGSIVSMHTRMRLAGGKLCLCGLNDQAKSLFDISDMDRILEIFDTATEFFAKTEKKHLAVLVE